MDMKQKGMAAKHASLEMAALDGKIKNVILKSIAKALHDNMDSIMGANSVDLRRSEKEGLAAPILKRLKFQQDKIVGVVDGIESLVELEDPVGKTTYSMEIDEGLELFRVTCPIGVVGVIFESRPDALVQISSLCLKSGNSVLLKGGSEAMETNRKLFEIIRDASVECGAPEGWIQLMETRGDVAEMLGMDDEIDLILPRGSNAFVKYIMDNSNIPVLGHSDGICHTYVHSDADMEKSLKVIYDAKTQYVAACNATETILVNQAAAGEFLPEIKKIFDGEVEIFGCGRTREYIDVKSADESNWKTEYLDYKVSVKVVESIDDAIKHINTYGSRHTECILTEDEKAAKRFMALVDAASTYWNCSTRFADGFRYGFGAEVGISTSKIHARGPVGLDGLTIYKYKMLGNGHIVEDYASKKRVFKHKRMEKTFE